MKKSHVTFVLAAFSLIFASCASKPKVEETKPAVEPAEEKVEQVVEQPEEEAPVVIEEDNSAALEADENARKSSVEEYEKAKALKNRIDELGFALYDQTSYDAGNKSLSDFENLKDSDSASGAELLNLSKDAYGKFANVLNKAYKQLAKEARTKAPPPSASRPRRGTLTSLPSDEPFSPSQHQISGSAPMRRSPS